MAGNDQIWHASRRGGMRAVKISLLPVVDDLSQGIGVEVGLYQGEDYNAVIEVMRSKNLSYLIAAEAGRQTN